MTKPKWAVESDKKIPSTMCAVHLTGHEDWLKDKSFPQAVSTLCEKHVAGDFGIQMGHRGVTCEACKAVLDTLPLELTVDFEVSPEQRRAVAAWYGTEGLADEDTIRRFIKDGAHTDFGDVLYDYEANNPDETK